MDQSNIMLATIDDSFSQNICILLHFIQRGILEASFPKSRAIPVISYLGSLSIQGSALPS
jgi:hypothetical protein